MKSTKLLSAVKRFLPFLILSMVLVSCQQDNVGRQGIDYSDDGFQLTIGGVITRSDQDNAVLEGMQWYCFDRSNVGGDEPAVGSSSTPVAVGSGALEAPFHHIVQGVIRKNNTFIANKMLTGSWDMAMVSARGASFTPPSAEAKAGEALMYTYDPTQNGGNAHPFYHRYHRLPEVTIANRPNTLSAVSRNVAKVQVTIEYVADEAVVSGINTVTLSNAPKYLSWAGTVLKSKAAGYTTSTSDFDVAAPITSNITFSRNLGSYTGDLNSQTLSWVIPAHRSRDFWQSNGVDPKINPKDTITKPLTLSLSLTKPGGHGTFTAEIDVPKAPLCDRILDVRIRIKNAQMEVVSSILPWPVQDIVDSVTEPYLNVLTDETVAYNVPVSIDFPFWSNQPAGEVYVEPQFVGASFGNVSDVFWRLSGEGAINCVYDPVTGEGHIHPILQPRYLATSPGNKEYTIRLRAGNKSCDIKIKTTMRPRPWSELGTRAILHEKPTYTYVGIFHRHNERGERLIQWPSVEEWNATAEGDPDVLDELMIDRSESTDLDDLPLETPTDPENFRVSKADDLYSAGDVYFRVGWRSNCDINSPRFAKIIIRKGIVIGSGDVLATIYVRQGEGAVALKSGQRAFLPYNVGIYRQPQYPNASQGLVTYPTQQGYLYQWGKSNAFAPDYLSTWSSNHDGVFTTDVCPQGYRYPTEEEMQSVVAGTGIRTEEGFCADGYFDRLKLRYWHSTTSGLLSSVGSGDKASYVGRIFCNSETNQSIFLPYGICRDKADGAPMLKQGNYWVSNTAPQSLKVTTAGAVCGQADPAYGYSVRCVKLNSATLTFDGNGHLGGTIPSVIVAQEEDRIAIPAGEPTRTGYTFKGWALNANGTGAVYSYNASVSGSASHIVMPMGEITLYAVWTINQYTIRWVSDGIELASETQPYLTPYTIRAAAVKNGYSFNGWSWTPDGGVPEVVLYQPGTVGNKFVQNGTYSAVWGINSYVLTGSNLGTTGNACGAGLAKAVVYNTDVAIDAGLRTGYTFAGWVSSNGGVFANAASASTTFTMPSNATTITAKWTINAWTLTGSNVGTTGNACGAALPKRVDYNSAVSIDAGSHAGYVFVGWISSNGGTFAQATDASTTFTMPNNATTITAQWVVQRYTVTFNLAGGTHTGGGALTQTGETGTAVTVPTTTKAGFVFTGWSPAAPSAIGTSNVICVAQWSQRYTVTFDLAGGTHTGGGALIQTGETGTAVTAPIATKAEVSFVGWSPAAPTTIGSSNVTCVAQWKRTVRVNFIATMSGVTGVMESQQIVAGEPTTLKPNAFTHRGYIFSQWTTMPIKPSSHSFNDGAVITATQDITLLASWKPKTINITLRTRGHGSLPDGTVIQAKYGQKINFPIPKRSARVYFMGWTINGSYPVDGICHATEDCVAYADWQKNFISSRGFWLALTEEPGTFTEAIGMDANSITTDIFKDDKNTDYYPNATTGCGSLGYGWRAINWNEVATLGVMPEQHWTTSDGTPLGDEEIWIAYTNEYSAKVMINQHKHVETGIGVYRGGAWHAWKKEPAWGWVEDRLVAGGKIYGYGSAENNYNRRYQRKYALCMRVARPDDW